MLSNIDDYNSGTETPKNIKEINHELIYKLIDMYDEHNKDKESLVQNQRHVELINDLVENNMRLVPWVLNRFFPWAEDTLKEELAQEGSIGLIEAAKHYDPFMGIEARGQPYEFSSLAVPYYSWLCP